MAQSNVAICGLVRDCAENLEIMVPKVENLGTAFGSYRVIVVENDSTDETGKVARRWSRDNPKVEAIQFCFLPPEHPARQVRSARENSKDGWFGRERIERIAFARNRYLDALAGDPSLDYVIVIDLDIRSFSVTGVAQSFGLADDWDIVTANGKRYSKRHPLRPSVYWDAYAFEPLSGFIDGKQTADQIRACQLDVARKLSESQSLLSAKSAFGGLGIYRAELLADHRYAVLDNHDPDVPVLCEHHSLHRSIRSGTNARICINPGQTVDYGSAMQLARYSLRSALRK
ncbi:MAG: hypothetical protein HKO99_11770 [Xanthomonadales bacterium]|nr:hypothetical protein [Xanthomonadales bacterium]